jgi:hypothetical protein
MEDDMVKATEHHILNNRHHPEFHSGKKENLINKDDRDSSKVEIVDGTKMSDVDLAEMCADWCAVSEERNNTPHEWAKKNIGTRWNFSEEQIALIYEILDEIWE